MDGKNDLVERALKLLDDYGKPTSRTPAPRPVSPELPDPDPLAAGTLIRFNSPLFGCLCTARVSMAEGGRVYVGDHSAMGDAVPCVIQRAWIMDPAGAIPPDPEPAHDVAPGSTNATRPKAGIPPKQGGS